MIEDPKMPNRIRRFNTTKRMLDVAVVIATLPLTVPVLVAVSIAVLLTQGRPIFYRQQRLGYQESTFSILKFRTMNSDQDRNGNLLPDVERLTKTGALLRKTSLDELPQITNILAGEMALVGPRPLYPRYLPYYTERERIRHLVRPGITGLAQVRGRNFSQWNDRFELDALYVERSSIVRDISIILDTIRQALFSKNVAVVAGTTGAPLDVARAFPRDRNLVLRMLAQRDLPIRIQWMNSPSTREFMSLGDNITVESTMQWFEDLKTKKDRYDFVVEDSNTSEVMAFVGVKLVDRREGETYIFVHPDIRGQGIGSRSQHLLLKWIFQTNTFDIVRSSVRRDNRASYRMHQKFGSRIISQDTDRDFIIVEKFAFAMTGDDH